MIANGSNAIPEPEIKKKQVHEYIGNTNTMPANTYRFCSYIITKLHTQKKKSLTNKNKNDCKSFYNIPEHEIKKKQVHGNLGNTKTTRANTYRFAYIL